MFINISNKYIIHVQRNGILFHCTETNESSSTNAHIFLDVSAFLATFLPQLQEMAGTHFLHSWVDCSSSGQDQVTNHHQDGQIH